MAEYRIEETSPGRFVGQRLEWSGDLSASPSESCWWKTVTGIADSPMEAEQFVREVIEYENKQAEFQERKRLGQTTIKRFEA